jgi:hypothetical protein
VTAAIALAAAIVPCVARAQLPPEPVARLTGHPERVASGRGITDVRAFAVTRSADRVLVAYTQAGEPRARGALRTALLREGSDHVLVREAPDHTLAPIAERLALSWNGRDGAVVYTVARPHRGERPGARVPRNVALEQALANPLGGSSLTAADVVFQRLDENGAPLGRPVLVFDENARAFDVALARDGDGWIVAWSGALSADGEITGTVRWNRIDAHGAPRAFASTTDFTGQVGAALEIVPAAGARTQPWVVFSGERCLTREDEPPAVQPPLDTRAANETRGHSSLPQQPPHEHPGPPIVCEGLHVYAAPLHAAGATGPIVTGPAITNDAVRVVMDNDAAHLVAPLERGLVVFDLDATGAMRERRVIASTASSPAPIVVDAGSILRAPAALDVSMHDGAVQLVALARTHTRFVFASAANTETLVATPSAAYGLALASEPSRDPWVFFVAGSSIGGPLLALRADATALQPAEPLTPWTGDERFMQQLARARAARAAYTAAETTVMQTASRPDAATNPALPGMIAGLHRVRGPWELACEALTERARWLARHGVTGDIVQIAGQQCELPPEPVVPGAVPVAAGAP